MNNTTDNNAHGVPLHRFVRLRDAVRGQYCRFEKGEVVKLSGELDSLRMERVKWRNSLTISNVLCNVPDWLILYDDAEEPNGMDEGRRTQGTANTTTDL